MTGVVAIPLVLLLAYTGGLLFFIFVQIVAGFCVWEFAALYDSRKISPYKHSLLLSSVFIITVLSYTDFYILLVLVPLMVFAEIFSRKNVLKRMEVYLLGLIYISIPFSLLVMLSAEYRYIFLLFVMIWSCDTFAFFGGKLFGRHKLSKISPKKTVEGAVSGFIFSVLSALVFRYFTGDFLSLSDALIIGAFTGIAGQAGDMFESYLKRRGDIKDSSDIIPGHGGVLDRFDSLIFTVPLLYAYVYFVKM